MITLINLKKINNIIDADYFHESRENELGHFKYDITTGKYVEIKYAGGRKQYGFGHIEVDLHRLVKHNIFPEKRVIIWY